MRRSTAWSVFRRRWQGAGVLQSCSAHCAARREPPSRRPSARSAAAGLPSSGFRLERNVVVGNALIEVFVWLRGGTCLRTLRGAGHRYRPVILAASLRRSVAATAATTQQDQILRFANHFGGVFLMPFLI